MKVDQYVVKGVLGRGGFGITYLVEDAGLQKDFALKEFFPDGLAVRDGGKTRFENERDFEWGLRRFYDEARLLARLNHPNIIAVRRVFEANSTAYMLLEFIEGQTLEKWLRRLNSPPTQEELDLVASPLLDALALVHANGAFHLDISPENVMIRSVDGAPILLDFGAARFEIKQHSHLVSATIVKAGYSAPEQYASSAKHYGPWTDMYGLAATLYRAIGGKRPIEAPSRQLSDDLEPAEQIGKGRYRPGFLRAVDWALKLSFEERPQTIGEWRRLLLEQTRSQPVENPVATRAHIESMIAEWRRLQNSPQADGSEKPDVARGNAEFLAKLMERSPNSNPPPIPDPLSIQPAEDAKASDKGATNHEPEEVGAEGREGKSLPLFLKQYSAHLAQDSSDARPANASTTNEWRRPGRIIPCAAIWASTKLQRFLTLLLRPGRKGDKSAGSEAGLNRGDRGGDGEQMSPAKTAHSDGEKPVRTRPHSAVSLGVAVVVSLLCLEVAWLRGSQIGSLQSPGGDGQPASKTKTAGVRDRAEGLATWASERFHELLGGRHVIEVKEAEGAASAFPPPPVPVPARCDGIIATIGISNDRRCIKPAAGKTELFRDCPECPEMVMVPAGSFTMGSPTSEPQRDSNEVQVRVTISAPLAVSRYAVRFDEWDACVADDGCNGYKPTDQGWGRGKHPVINVSWDDAKGYVAWVSRKTGKTYRLLSEAEREYVTRSGTTTSFWWGTSITPTQANYNGNYTYDGGGSKGEYRKRTIPVDSFESTAWGLYNVHGNVWEWAEDCWNESNAGNPGDGRARMTGDCRIRVARGGSWFSVPQLLRAASRIWLPTDYREDNLGFRLARTLDLRKQASETGNIEPFGHTAGSEAAERMAETRRVEVILAESARRVSSGDVPGAREVLAAAEKNAPGLLTLALAETYDPNVLAAWGAHGIISNVVKAKELYGKALGLGIARAHTLLEALGGRDLEGHAASDVTISVTTPLRAEPASRVQLANRDPSARSDTEEQLCAHSRPAPRCSIVRGTRHRARSMGRSPDRAPDADHHPTAWRAGSIGRRHQPGQHQWRPARGGSNAAGRRGPAGARTPA